MIDATPGIRQFGFERTTPCISPPPSKKVHPRSSPRISDSGRPRSPWGSAYFLRPDFRGTSPRSLIQTVLWPDKGLIILNYRTEDCADHSGPCELCDLCGENGYSSTQRPQEHRGNAPGGNGLALRTSRFVMVQRSNLPGNSCPAIDEIRLTNFEVRSETAQIINRKS